MMKKEAARLCGNARMAGRFALQEQKNRGIIKTIGSENRGENEHLRPFVRLSKKREGKNNEF